jgi:hypothetical protein
MIRKLDLGELREPLTALPQWNFDEARGAIGASSSLPISRRPSPS